MSFPDNKTFPELNLSKESLTVNFLTCGFIFAFLPDGITLIEVEFDEYPIPGLTTSTETIFPFSMVDLNWAPVPDPLESITSKSGIEKYSIPPYPILTLFIEPFTMTGFKLAFFPFFIEIIGFFS